MDSKKLLINDKEETKSINKKNMFKKMKSDFF